jgi:hypothetical protein
MSYPGVEERVPTRPPSQRGRTVVRAVVAILTVAALAAGGAVAWRRFAAAPQAAPAGSTEGPTATPTVDVAALPPVDGCYLGTIKTSFNTEGDSNKLVQCGVSHELETISVGTFDGAGAQTYPAVTAEPTVAAFDACDTAAQTFLGGDWRNGYLKLVLSVPGSQAWLKGARWYRCDVGATRQVRGETVSSLATLRGAMSGQHPGMAISCLNWLPSDTGGDVMQAVACDIGHYSEFAGSIRLPWPETYDKAALQRDASRKCESLVLAYLGTNRLSPDLTFWYGYHPSDQRRDLDDSEPCIIGAKQSGRAFKSSLKGIGNGAVPFT